MIQLRSVKSRSVNNFWKSLQKPFHDATRRWSFKRNRGRLNRIRFLRFYLNNDFNFMYIKESFSSEIKICQMNLTEHGTREGRESKRKEIFFMKLLIEFVSFNIYCFFYLRHSRIRHNSFSSKQGIERNNKQLSDKVNIHI